MPTLVASNATGWPNIGSSQFFAIGPGLWVDIFIATELQDTTIRFTTNLALTPLRNEVFDGFAFEENNGFRPRNRSEKLHLDSFSLAFHLQTLEEFCEFDHPR